MLSYDNTHRSAVPALALLQKSRLPVRSNASLRLDFCYGLKCLKLPACKHAPLPPLDPDYHKFYYGILGRASMLFFRSSSVGI